MVGDTPAADVSGATRAGIDAILATAHATDPASEPVPDATVSRLKGLFEERPDE